MPLVSMIASVVADCEVGSVVGFTPMSAADRPVTGLGVLAIRCQFRADTAGGRRRLAGCSRHDAKPWDDELRPG